MPSEPIRSAIDLRMLDEEVDRAADVVQTLRRNLHQPRLAAAFTLVGGVVGERDEALLGETLGIEAGGLLLHAAERVRHDDRRILTVRIEARRLEEIGDDRRPHVPGRVRDPFDRHALLVGISDHRRLLDCVDWVAVPLSCEPPTTAPERTSADVPRNARLFSLMTSWPFRSPASSTGLQLSPASCRTETSTADPRSGRCSGPTSGSACCHGCRLRAVPRA